MGPVDRPFTGPLQLNRINSHLRLAVTSYYTDRRDHLLEEDLIWRWMRTTGKTPNQSIWSLTVPLTDTSCPMFSTWCLRLKRIDNHGVGTSMLPSLHNFA